MVVGWWGWGGRASKERGNFSRCMRLCSRFRTGAGKGGEGQALQGCRQAEDTAGAASPRLLAERSRPTRQGRLRRSSAASAGGPTPNTCVEGLITSGQPRARQQAGREEAGQGRRRAQGRCTRCDGSLLRQLGAQQLGGALLLLEPPLQLLVPAGAHRCNAAWQPNRVISKHSQSRRSTSKPSCPRGARQRGLFRRPGACCSAA